MKPSKNIHIGTICLAVLIAILWYTDTVTNSFGRNLEIHEYWTTFRKRFFSVSIVIEESSSVPFDRYIHKLKCIRV